MKNRIDLFYKKKNSYATQRKAKGFSLLEVMFSSVIFLIAVSGTLSAYSTLSKARAHQRYMVYALHIAESHLEESLTYSKNDSQIIPGSNTTGIAYYTNKGVRKGASSFFRVDISAVNHAVVSDVIVVRVKVTWTENGRQHSFDLKTARA